MGLDAVDGPFVVLNSFTNYLGVHPSREEPVVVGNVDP
jgi:hypothetical protein